MEVSGRPFPLTEPGDTATEKRNNLPATHTGGFACKQRAPLTAGQFKLRGLETSSRETRGSMLSISELGSFYYLRNFHVLRCKHARALSVIRQQMDRESRRVRYISWCRKTVRRYAFTAMTAVRAAFMKNVSGRGISSWKYPVKAEPRYSLSVGTMWAFCLAFSILKYWVLNKYVFFRVILIILIFLYHNIILL